MAVRIGGQAVIEGVMMKNMDRLCSIRAKAQWQDRDKSRRMRKFRRETSIIQITDFPWNGKFLRIHGNWNEDTKLLSIFL